MSIRDIQRSLETVNILEVEQTYYGYIKLMNHDYKLDTQDSDTFIACYRRLVDLGYIEEMSIGAMIFYIDRLDHNEINS